jgi:hypothetical protein
MLGIGPSTGWKWVRQGKLRVIRVGPNLTMIEVAELRGFLARHTVATPSPELLDAAE